MVAASITSFMQDGRAWPSRLKIAERAGIPAGATGERAVTRAIARIRALGLMEIEDRSGRSSVYSMTKPSAIATLGSSDPGSLRPRSLGSGYRGTLGSDDRVERNKELNQRTSARSRAQNEKKETGSDEGISTDLIQLLRRSGSNGNLESDAAFIERQCSFPGGRDRAIHWLAYAIAARIEKPVDYAISQAQRGEDLPERARVDADALIATCRGVAHLDFVIGDLGRQSREESERTLRGLRAAGGAT